MLAKSIMNKIEITPIEANEIGLRAHTTVQGSLVWGSDATRQAEKEDILLDVDFSDAELKLLKDEERKKDESKQLNISDLELAEKISSVKYKG
jgi:hypothetical protein